MLQLPADVPRDIGRSDRVGDLLLGKTFKSVPAFNLLSKIPPEPVIKETAYRIIVNGKFLLLNSVIDALLRYYVNGGGFKHVMDGELDGMATEQAYYALTAYYRFLTGKTNLYDMTDTINKGGDPVEVEPTVPATTEPAEVEPAKTNFPWWILVICVVGGCGLGMVIAIVIIPKFKKKD